MAALPYPTYSLGRNYGKNCVFLLTHTFAYHIRKKGWIAPAPQFLLAERCLEDGNQRVVLALRQGMPLRIDKL